MVASCAFQGFQWLISGAPRPSGTCRRTKQQLCRGIFRRGSELRANSCTDRCLVPRTCGKHVTLCHDRPDSKLIRTNAQHKHKRMWTADLYSNWLLPVCLLSTDSYRLLDDRRTEDGSFCFPWLCRFVSGPFGGLWIRGRVVWPPRHLRAPTIKSFPLTQETAGIPIRTTTRNPSWTPGFYRCRWVPKDAEKFKGQCWRWCSRKTCLSLK